MRILSLMSREYRNLGMRKRLILSFFLMAVVLILIISFYSYARVSQTMRQEATRTTRQIISSLVNAVEYRLEETRRLGEQAVSSTVVQRVVNHSRDDYALEEQIQDCRDVVEYLTFLQDTNEVFRIRLFIPDGVIYARENGNIMPLETVAQSQWCQVLLQDKSPYHFHSGTTYYVWNITQQVVSCTVPLWRYDYQDLAGVVSVDVQLSSLTELLDAGAVSSDSTILLLGSDGYPITTSGPDISQSLLDSLNSVNDDGDWIASDRGREYFAYRQRVSGTDWYLGYLLPADTVLGASIRFRTELIIMLVLVVGLAFLLAIWGSRINTRRITQLAQRMAEVQAGDLSVSAKIHSQDEIGGLERSFNYLMRSVSELIDKQTAARDQLRDTELRLLQSQIQPHFLYNTLDLINWRVLRLGDRETSRMILELSRFYKISLSRGREMITIRDEVEHATLYVSIQNHRFEDAITLTVSVQDDILDLMIPKVTLQPLVENAILHGLQEKTATGRGNIRIEGRREREWVVMEVRDDGQGMDEERMACILDENKERHYGVWNIHQRFQITFGSGYGLSYLPNTPTGVRVLIRFPQVHGLN